MTEPKLGDAVNVDFYGELVGLEVVGEPQRIMATVKFTFGEKVVDFQPYRIAIVPLEFLTKAAEPNDFKSRESLA